MSGTSIPAKFSAVLCVLIVLLCYVLGLLELTESVYFWVMACALVLFSLSILALPGIARSVRSENDGITHFAILGLGWLGLAGLAAVVPTGWYLGSVFTELTAQKVSLFLIGLYFLFVSLRALQRHAWPIPVSILGLANAVIIGVFAIVEGESLLLMLLLLLVSLPLLFFLLAIRLWSGATNYTANFNRRAAMACAVLVAVLFVAWAYLDWSGARLLQNEVARLKSAGAMTSMDEVLALATPADQDPNGKKVVDFFLSLSAEKTPLVVGISVGKTEIFGKSFTANLGVIEKEWSPEIAAGVKEACDKNRAVIDQALEISQLPPAKTGTWIDAQKAAHLFEFKIPSLSQMRGVANLLSLQALLAAKEGRPDEVLQNAGALLGLTNHLADSYPLLITRMIAVAFRSMATRSVHLISADASFSDAAIGAFNEKIMQSLRPDELTRCMETERLCGLNLIQAGVNPIQAGVNFVAPGNAFGHAGSLLYGSPVFRFLRARDGVRVLQGYDMLIEEARLSPRQARDKESEFLRFCNAIPLYYPMGRLMMPSGFRAVLDYHNSRTNLLETRIALALMQHKHATGSYPDTLDAITPALGGAVPQDPFSEGPFLYRKDGNGFLLYSVGENFEDNKGMEHQDIVWRTPA